METTNNNLISFRDKALESGYSNNSVRKYLLSKGYNKEEVDNVAPLDVEELRDEFMSKGYSEEQYKTYMKSKGFTASDLDMYKLDGETALQLTQGRKKSDVISEATELIKSDNMEYSEAAKLLRDFYKLSYKDVESIMKNIYVTNQLSPQELVDKYKQQGYNDYAANNLAIRKLRSYNRLTPEGDESNPVVTNTLKPIRDGLANWALTLVDGALGFFGAELPDDIKKTQRLLKWKAEGNILTEGTSKGANMYAQAATLGSGSLIKALALTAAQAGATTYADSILSGKTRDEAKMDMYLASGIAVAFPFLGTGAYYTGKGLVNTVSGVSNLLKNPIKTTKQWWDTLATFTGDAATAAFSKEASKQILQSYENNPQAKRALLDSLSMLQEAENKVFTPYLMADTTNPSLMKSVLDVSSRGLFANKEIQDFQIALRDSLTRDIDNQLSQVFGGKVYQGVIDGVDKFSQKIINVLDTARSSAIKESQVLYKEKNLISDKISLSSKDAKALSKSLEEAWKKSETIAHYFDGQSYMGVAERLVSDLSLGQDIANKAFKTYKAKNSTQVESKNLTEFFKFVSNTFKDKFTAEELTSALSSVNNYYKRYNRRFTDTEKNEMIKFRDTLKSLLINKEKTGRGQRTPTLTDLSDVIKQINVEYKQNIDPLARIIKGSLSSIEKRLGTSEYLSAKNKADTHFKNRIETFESKSAGGESLGIFNLLNSTRSDSTVLMRELTGKNGANLAYTIGKELDNLASKSPKLKKEVSGLKTQIARYLIDSKIYQSGELDSLGKTLSALDNIPEDVLTILVGKESVKTLTNIKNLLQRYVDIDKTITPTRWSVTPPQSLGFVKSTLSKLSIGKLLTDKELSKQILNSLKTGEKSKTYIPARLQKTIDDIKQSVNTTIDKSSEMSVLLARSRAMSGLNGEDE